MSPNVQWKVTITGESTRTLNQWSTRLRNAAPAFDEMADVIAENQKTWFKTEGEGTWAPLKEPYRSWKRKRFPKRGILHGPDRPGHRGLQLRDQLTRQGGPSRNTFGIERIGAREMVIGSNLPYAVAHQTGAGRLPVRKALKPLDSRTEAILVRILQAHIVGETIGRG